MTAYRLPEPPARKPYALPRLTLRYCLWWGDGRGLLWSLVHFGFIARWWLFGITLPRLPRGPFSDEVQRFRWRDRGKVLLRRPLAESSAKWPWPWWIRPFVRDERAVAIEEARVVTQSRRLARDVLPSPLSMRTSRDAGAVLRWRPNDLRRVRHALR